MSQHWNSIKEVEEAATNIVITSLANGAWTTVKELLERIPAELAEARCQESTPACDQMSESERQAFGRGRFLAVLVPILRHHPVCESQTGTDGQEEFRWLTPVQPSDQDVANVQVVVSPDQALATTTAPDSQSPHQDPELPYHPMALVFPDMTDQEYADLKQSIEEIGQQDVIWTHQGQIVDGRHRYRACRELGRVPRLEEWNGDGSPLAFVLARNLHRRQLDASQRALVAARLKPHFEEEARARMLAGKSPDPMANLPQGPARDQPAQLLNVSPRSVEHASKVVQEGTPALQHAVETKTVKVSAAAELTVLPNEEQDRVVAGGKEAIATKVKQLRQQKAKASQHHGDERIQQAETLVEDDPQAGSVPVHPGNALDLDDPEMVAFSRSLPPNEAARQLLSCLGREWVQQVQQTWAELLQGKQG